MEAEVLRNGPEAAGTPWCEENLVTEGLQPMDNSWPVHCNRGDTHDRDMFHNYVHSVQLIKSKSVN
jgi:hypothetical protein